MLINLRTLQDLYETIFVCYSIHGMILYRAYSSMFLGSIIEPNIEKVPS